MSSRMTAYRLIDKVEKNAYSNLAVDAVFGKSDLSSRDKAFAARIFYGVTERRITLEHIIDHYSKKPCSKLDSSVRIVLMMGLYQLKFMDNVPDNAAVNESVELIRKLKMNSAAGFVNAVLRNFIRDGKEIPEVIGDEYDRLSVEYSCPRELIERICEGYGKENCISLLESSLCPSVCSVRVNTLKTDGVSLVNSFEGRGISCCARDDDENCVICDNLTDVSNDSDFIRGNYHIQDYSSQLCCKAVAPDENDIVIDLCAAPGGKTFTIAEMMKNTGTVYACELHEKRTRLISEGAERLGITNIRTVTNDARVRNESFPLADRVLCDVPCSGYGVIKGKPEIRYKPLSDSERLPEIQYDILKTASSYVRKGGILVYSTCTVNIMENERVTERFLTENPEFTGDMFPENMGEHFAGKYSMCMFSRHSGGDGFFICRMRRKEDGED